MKIKRLLSRGIAVLILSFFVITQSAPDVYACTGAYVGKQVSDDGTVIMARSNDHKGTFGNYVKIMERVENKPGRTMPVDCDSTVFTELPPTTYRCISTPFMDSTQARLKCGADATVCENEYGVTMTAAVTAFSNKNALKADPYVKNGLTENATTDLVICQSKTAREGTEVLLSLIDRYGSSESNIAFIADQNEAWYIEMYSGHQYAAVRLPDDKVSVFGNEFNLEYVSDYEEYILSPELEDLAVQNGFAKYGRNDELNLLDTYSGSSVLTDYSHRRTWIGHKLLSPSVYGDYEENSRYPLCFEPDEMVSVQDVMELMRDRYENTEFSPDEAGRTDVRVIGTDTAMSVHVIQVYPSLPADMSCIIWESTGPAVYGAFVPISNASLSISEPYGKNQSAEEVYRFDTDNYPYYRFKEINTLCVENDTYEIYGLPTRAYWHDAESRMAATMKTVLENASKMESDKAHKYITGYSDQVQEYAFEDAGNILNEIIGIIICIKSVNLFRTLVFFVRLTYA